MRKLFICDGRTTFVGSITILSISFGGILGVLYFQPSRLIGISIFVASVIVGMIGIGSGAAESVGLKPFTNDPLGWRKAKKSYKPPRPESSPDDQAPKP